MHRTLLVAAVLGVSVPAHAATVLDFDSTRGKNGSTGYVYGPYTEDGYQLTAQTCSKTNICFSTTGTTLTSLDRVGAALTNYQGSSQTTLTAVDGGVFRLIGMDMAGNYGNYEGYGASTLGAIFTFVFADGTTQTQTLSLANTAGQRLTVNPLDFSSLAPLKSVSWTPGVGTSSFLQFDNIRVLAGVPEPATWGLMILGLGAVGATLRRRRAAIRFA